MKIELDLSAYLSMEEQLLKGGVWQYLDGELYGEAVKVTDIVKSYGSPLYVYSRHMIEENCQVYRKALAHLPVRICYATKANDRIAIQKIIRQQGLGIDTVSAGEIKRAIAAGFTKKDIVFSGVGKAPEDIAFAIRHDIDRINVEAEEEIEHIAKNASFYKRQTQIGFRFNPDITAGGNDKIQTGRKSDKFGLDGQTILKLFDRAKDIACITANGLSIHLGSQIHAIDAYEQAGKKLVTLVHMLKRRGHSIRHIDLGGGFGISYGREKALHIDSLCKWIGTMQSELDEETSFDIEPGRSIVAHAGILVTRVNAVKQQKRLLVVDAGMHSLLRPSLYDSYHHVLPLQQKPSLSRKDIVGPICESGDRLAFGRWLPPLFAGDYLAILTTGAYGSVFANLYNARGLPREVLIDEDKTHQIFFADETFEKELQLTKEL